jgi:hypothetical protein
MQPRKPGQPHKGWKGAARKVKEHAKCEMPGCEGRGVKGNENVINGRLVCDYCHAKLMQESA